MAVHLDDRGSAGAGATTTLHQAASKGDVRCAKAVVDRMLADYVPLEAIVDNNFDDLMGRTPLHLAAERGHVAMVEYLVANAADVNARDSVSRRHAGRDERDVHEDDSRSE